MAEQNVEEGEEFEFATYEGADDFILQHENRSGTRYVRQKTKKERISDIQSLEGRRPVIGKEGLFITLDNEMRECHHGRRRTKRRPITNEKKRRVRAQDTKKMNCPARIIIKTILVFPEYEIEKNSTRKEKSKILKQFRDDFLSKQQERQLRVCVKLAGKHTNHDIGEAADFNQIVDKEIQDFIRKKMDEGVHNIEEMLSRISDLSVVQGSRITNRRYHPTRKTVYNIMYNRQNSLRQTNDDQTNTKLYLERKAALADPANIFYRPAVSPDSDLEGVEDVKGLLIIYQSKFQAEILKKYGGEVALLDSTYNTCNFSVPLYLLAVQTNTGFVVVASFILGRDTKEQIHEALQKIKNVNKTWNPKFFLTDYDPKEIGAIEALFPDTTHLLCQFHVIQAWKRWTQNNKELGKEEKSYLVQVLRNICNSNSAEEYTDKVEQLKKTDVYQSDRKVQGWLETRWFSEKERWVDCYREKMDLRNDTTNGLEVQHREFKRFLLNKEGIGGSLENVVKVLVDKYLPKMEIRYKEINQRAKSTSKLYAADVPEFLVNRPPLLVEHCLKRMPPKIPEIIRIKAHDSNSDTFIVKSSEAADVYEVSFPNLIPRCTCPDFRKKHWPCKHLLAVVCRGKEYAWEILNKGYTQQECFILDEHPGKSKDMAEPQATPEDHTYCFEDTSSTILTETLSIVQARKNCLEETQMLTNNMYGIDDIDIINDITARLKKINTEIQTKIPSVKNLPLRRRKRTQKPSIPTCSNVKRKKVNEKEDIIEEIVIDNFDLNIEDIEAYRGTNLTDAMLQKNFDSQVIDPHEKALKEILLERSGEEVVMEVGPYKLTRETFHCLKEELADEMIDAYLSLLLKGKNVYHLCCSTATEIFYSAHKILHGHLRHEVLSQWEYILGVVNQANDHWILVIILTHEKKLLIIDPLCAEDELSDSYLQNWYNFLRGRQQRYGITELIGNWSVSTLPHSRQVGISSCGVYALKFAECFALNQPLVFRWDNKDVIAERMKIGTKLLASATELFRKEDVVGDSGPFTGDSGPVTFDSDPVTGDSGPVTGDLGPVTRDLGPVTCDSGPVTGDSGPVTGDLGPLTRDLDPVTSDSGQVTGDLGPVTGNLGPVTSDSGPVTGDSGPVTEDSGPVTGDSDPMTGHLGPVTGDSGDNIVNKKKRPRRLNLKKKSSIGCSYDIKKKRILPPSKVQPKVYCKCQRPNDHTLYWNCEMCDNWFHPRCVGKTKEEEPEFFFCDKCQSLGGNEDYGESDTDMEICSESDDENISKDNRISGKQALGSYQQALAVIKRIIKCQSPKCKNPVHKGHHQFLDNYQTVRLRERNRCGFGEEFFNMATMKNLQDKMSKDLIVYLPSKRNPCTSPRIMMLDGVPEGSKLWNLFTESTLAMYYLPYVLNNELVLILATIISNKKLETCRDICKRTEMDKKNL